jgi:hypothetical protein
MFELFPFHRTSWLGTEMCIMHSSLFWEPLTELWSIEEDLLNEMTLHELPYCVNVTVVKGQDLAATVQIFLRTAVFVVLLIRHFYFKTLYTLCTSDTNCCSKLCYISKQKEFTPFNLDRSWGTSRIIIGVTFRHELYWVRRDRHCFYTRAV